jgi:GGDEF-like domain
MDSIPTTGPVDERIGRWLLDRLVATAVRYGHPFVMVLVRSPDTASTADRLARVLRGADVVVAWSPGELLVLLPDTDAQGAARAAGRLRAAAPEAWLCAVTWNGDLAEDLVERAAQGLGAVAR